MLTVIPKQILLRGCEVLHAHTSEAMTCELVWPVHLLLIIPSWTSASLSGAWVDPTMNPNMTANMTLNMNTVARSPPPHQSFPDNCLTFRRLS